jgi:hypothetical protein
MGFEDKFKPEYGAKDIEEMIEDCQQARTCSNSPFTKWEEDFIDSVSNHYELRGDLSEKQEETLEKIWEKI